MSLDLPPGVQDIRYLSALDKTEQPALFYCPENLAAPVPLPLLVALHTWSYGYDQKDYQPYLRFCSDNGWVMIHPHFRGPNNTPEGCGSDLAVQDIVDAVAYARSVADVDPSRVYLMGGSGGGYASLLMAGRHPELWAGVSAWVPIWDLALWHRQCVATSRGYYKHMDAACGGAPGTSPEIDRQYRVRSAKTYLKNAAGVAMDINAGITDGHIGSVPIDHTLRAFNQLSAPKDRIGADAIAYLVEKQAVPPSLKKASPDPLYGEKRPLFRKISRNVRITIFDGGHEIVHAAGLSWLAAQRRGLEAVWNVQAVGTTRFSADDAKTGR